MGGRSYLKIKKYIYYYNIYIYILYIIYFHYPTPYRSLRRVANIYIIIIIKALSPADYPYLLDYHPSNHILLLTLGCYPRTLGTNSLKNRTFQHPGVLPFFLSSHLLTMISGLAMSVILFNHYHYI